MEAAVLEAREGLAGRENIIAENALAYAELLREHISKEDTILYPLAERVIPEAMRGEIVNGYQRAEAQAEAGFSERYQKLVEAYEQE
jgi:hemerythrin-like domain-containing protein